MVPLPPQGYVETLLGRRRHSTFHGGKLAGMRSIGGAPPAKQADQPEGRLRNLAYSGPSGAIDAMTLREASNMPMQVSGAAECMQLSWRERACT